MPSAWHEQAAGSALGAASKFIGRYWQRILGLSALALVPCFWHRLIEAGDLGSHVYNAWLVQLIERGRAPGLWLAHPSSNVLFDLALSNLGGVVGLGAAEKIVVSAAVLIFFWGAFAFVSAVTRRTAWAVVPCLLMFAYGWTFEQGLMNFYVSIGLAFWGLAVVSRGRGAERLLAVALVPLIWMAHPLGLVFLAGAGAYLALASRLGLLGQLVLLAAAGLMLYMARLIIAAHYEALWPTAGLSRFFSYNGADQLVLFGPRYRLLAYLFLLFALVCLGAEVIRDRVRPEPLAKYALPLQLYLVAMLAAFLLPTGMQLPQFPAPALLLTDRLTSVTAILACCLLGAMKPKHWHVIGFAALAAVFFVCLYGDTATLNKMEVQVGRYERVLPAGQRIVATIWPFRGSRILIQHIVDRACVGYCFSYGNYEPSSGQFRVRAREGNRFVAAKFENADAIERGQYVVQKSDLPLFQIYQCNLNLTTLCMRELAAGERNGDVGVQVKLRPN